MMRQSKRVRVDPRNQPRKRIDITIEAFSMFAKDKPENVKLYLHMGIIDSHINLEKMSRRYGILPRLIVSNTRSGVQTVSREKLNQIYNACDVGLNTGLGEGWGLVNMEHAVTGAPQIVGKHSSLQELYFDCGLLLDPMTKYTLDGIMTTGRLLRTEDVAKAMNMLYTNKDLYDQLSEASVNKFTQESFQWEIITDYWVKIFTR